MTSNTMNNDHDLSKEKNDENSDSYTYCIESYTDNNNSDYYSVPEPPSEECPVKELDHILNNGKNLPVGIEEGFILTELRKQEERSSSLKSKKKQRKQQLKKEKNEVPEKKAELTRDESESSTDEEIRERLAKLKAEN